MMGEFGAITGGGITNFSSMVDGAEGYGAQIDALGSLEYQDKKAIGYSQQQKALPHKSIKLKKDFFLFFRRTGLWAKQS